MKYLGGCLETIIPLSKYALYKLSILSPNMTIRMYKIRVSEVPASVRIPRAKPIGLSYPKVGSGSSFYH